MPHRPTLSLLFLTTKRRARASNLLMSSRSGWIKATLCASAALFGTGFKVGAQPLADRAPISGAVVDETGHPVASAVLTLRRQEDNGPSAFWGTEARANTDGQFRVSGAQEGRYFVSVEAPGYAPLSNLPLNWRAGLSPLRLSLSRLTRVVLLVSRADGTPLSNAPLWVRLRMPESNPNSQMSVVRATTDAQGEAVVPAVVPATYNLLVVSSEGIGLERDVPVAWNGAGARLGVRLKTGATFKIKADDAQGQSLGGASLSLLPRSSEEAARLGGAGASAGENWALNAAANSPRSIVTLDGDGTLELPNLPAGLFTARLSLPGYGAITRDIETGNGQTVEWTADFPTHRAATLVLDVRDADGRPVVDSLVALRLLPLAADGSFAPSSPFEGTTDLDGNGLPGLPFFVSGPGGRIGRTDAQSQLTLFPLKEGRYRVFASRPMPGDWLRFPVAREGAPLDIQVTLDQPNKATVQVP